MAQKTIRLRLLAHFLCSPEVEDAAGKGVLGLPAGQMAGGTPLLAACHVGIRALVRPSGGQLALRRPCPLPGQCHTTAPGLPWGGALMAMHPASVLAPSCKPRGRGGTAECGEELKPTRPVQLTATATHKAFCSWPLPRARASLLGGTTCCWSGRQFPEVDVPAQQ